MMVCDMYIYKIIISSMNKKILIISFLVVIAWCNQQSVEKSTPMWDSISESWVVWVGVSWM